MSSVHVPVLLNEVVEGLSSGLNNGDFKPSKQVYYLDGTLGGCGHAIAMAGAFAGRLNIIGLDANDLAISEARQVLGGKAQRLILKQGNFKDLDLVLKENGIDEVDMILFDLGISSDELETSGRGFAFSMKDEPLIMTMGDPGNYPFVARDIVNNWDEGVIADVIYGYGGEKFARRIARAIATYRSKKAIETSGELAELIKNSVPAFYRRAKIHPATKTFQAIRIAVNDELNALREGLNKGYRHLAVGGRMAVISFHSLEDRIVKEFYRKCASDGANIITKKPIGPSELEISENPRSRSAKLRIIEKGVSIV